MVKDEGKQFENPPPGLWPAFMLGWFDIGTQPGYEGKPTHQVVGLWELIVLDEAGNEVRMTKGEYAGKRFLMSKTYTYSLNEAANLSIDLCNWRGRAFDAAEREEGFDLDVTKGRPCVLNITAYVKRDGKPGVKIATVNPAIRGGPAWHQETPANYVPAWIQKKMTEGSAALVQQGQGMPPEDEGIPF